jgi:hypothetical protein
MRVDPLALVLSELRDLSSGRHLLPAEREYLLPAARHGYKWKKKAE